MVRHYIYAALILLFMTACAIPYKQLDSNPAFSPHQYSSKDMNFSWKSEQLNNALLVDGVASNISDNYLYEALELEATLLDMQGKNIAMQTYHFTPLKFKGPEAFKMVFPLEGGVLPERIIFHYKYGVDEDRFSVEFESKL